MSLHIPLFLLSLLLLLLLPFPSLSTDQPEELVDFANLVDMQYHDGPLCTAPIRLYPIWYGKWDSNAQSIIRDFLSSLSSWAPSPSVSDWWRTVTYYTDRNNVKVTASLAIAAEYYDSTYSQGNALTRASMELIIKAAVSASVNSMPVDAQGVYLVLTAPDVKMEEFCRGVCGFHYYTSTSTVGASLPFAWIGHSGTQCPGMCAFPFAVPPVNPGFQVLQSPNGDAATDGMIGVIAHELAEVATNTDGTGWYAGDGFAPNEICDLCEGIYGTGAGSGLIGSVLKGSDGGSYNVYGVNGKRFMLHWLWNPVKKRCDGPNAIN